MVWTASIYDKGILAGKITVVVQYTDGTSTFNEIYESKGVPPINWIEHIVFNRLSQLNSQDIGTIPSGPIIPIDPTPLPQSTEQTDWNNRFRKMQMIDLLLKYNLIPANDPDLQALKTYLTNNWKTFIKE